MRGKGEENKWSKEVFRSSKEKPSSKKQREVGKSIEKNTKKGVNFDQSEGRRGKNLISASAKTPARKQPLNAIQTVNSFADSDLVDNTIANDPYSLNASSGKAGTRSKIKNNAAIQLPLNKMREEAASVAAIAKK